MYAYERRQPAGLASLPAGSWPACLLVLLVLSGGLLAGAMYAGRLDYSKSAELSFYIKSLLHKAGETNFESFSMARSAMINNTITVASIYVLGLTIIGMPVTLAILFARGFAIGFASGFLTRDLSLGGVLLTAAAILPHNLFYIPAICIGTAYSLIFSTVLLKRYFDTSIKIWPGFLKYTAVMSAVLMISLGAGLIEGYVTPYFTKAAAEAISSGYNMK